MIEARARAVPGAGDRRDRSQGSISRLGEAGRAMRPRQLRRTVNRTGMHYVSSRPSRRMPYFFIL